MKKYIGLLLLIIAYNLSSQTIDVQTENDLITIKINSLSKKFIQTKHSNYDYVKLNGVKNTIPAQKGDYLFDELQLLVALPEDIDYKLEKKLYSKRLLSNSFNYTNDFTELVTLQKIGKQRGITTGIIRINPFSFEEYSNSLFIFDSIEITVKFNKPIATTKLGSDNPEYKFFSEYINKQQIPELLKKGEVRREKDVGKKEKMQKDDWYKPEIKYVKLMTKNDGIAKVNAQDLINVESSFGGKDIIYFHLIYKGEEVPISFNNDIDGIMNNGDEIIFLGHRGEGDTTWFNHYSDYSAYYLYYEETAPGLRFMEFPEVTNATKTVDYVNINKHIEFEKVYLHGDFKLQHDIENIHREGWLWQEIDSDRNNKFTNDLLLQAADTINIGINLMSVYWNNAQIRKHDLSFVLNNDTLSKFSIDTGKILNFKQKLSINKLISGKNNFQIVNYSQYDTDTIKIIPNDIGIDFFKISGKTRPTAFNGKLNFTLESQTENFKLIIPNFRTKDNFILEKKNNYLSKFQGQSGTNIIAGAKNGVYPWSSIVINDSAFSTGTASISIAVLKGPNYITPEFKTFTDLNNQVVDFLNAIPNGSIITLTYNSTKAPNANIVSKLQSLGSTAVGQVKVGETWTFAVKTDDISSAIEKHVINGNSNINKFFKHDSGKSYQIEKNFEANTNFEILADDLNALETAQVFPVNNSLLRNQNHRADAIFITHSKFKAGADSLADYRRNQGFEVEVVDIEDVYKEFNFGIKSAHAIKSFLQYANKNWQKPVPQYLLLIGDANWSGNKARTITNVDYIPSYGWPVSDFWYVCLDSANDYLHDMYVGRIPASEPQHISNLISKIKEYEEAPRMPWMKKFLSLTGGGEDGEKEIFKENMDGILYSHWMNKPLAGDTMVVAKSNGTTVGVAEANEIISKIDAGAVWVNFYGHGAPDVFDMDGWHSEKLNNKGKYSFFTTISCNTAAFAEDTLVARNENYLTIADKGFIGTAGSTNLGVDIPGMQIISNMMDIVNDTILRQRSLGEIVNNAKINMIGYDPITRAFAQQFVLLGDPMTKIRISSTRDIYTLDNELKITNTFGNRILIETDSVALISGYVFNNGFCEENHLRLRLISKYNEDTNNFYIDYSGLCTKEQFLFDSLSILNKPGIHKIELYAELADTTLLIYQGSFEVYKSGLLALEPLPYWNVDGEKMHFRFINPMQNSNDNYEFYLAEIDLDGKEDIIYQSKNIEINVLENCIDWLPDTTLAYGNKYFLYARYLDQTEQLESSWLRIPFASDKQEPENVKVNFNNEFLNNLSLQGLEQVNENNQSYLKFKNFQKSFSVVSARGNATIDRFCEIVYDDILYIYTPSTSNAPVGINLVVVSGEDGEFITSKKYNTWDGENSTRDLVNFMNDTVKAGDWLLLSSCGSAWRMFYHTGLNNPDAVGSFKSFKETLARFGSQEVYQIPDGSDIVQASFAFAGRKDKPNSRTLENIVQDGIQISIIDSITIFPMDAVLEIPGIFSAKKWESCKIDADIDFSQASSTLSIYGHNYDNSVSPLEKFIDALNVDLSFMDSLKLPGVAISLKIRRFSEDTDIKISNIELDFTPSHELAIIKSKSGFLSDTVMRGEDSEFTYSLENLSLRSPAENNKIYLIIQPNGVNEIVYPDTIAFLAQNESTSADFQIETLQLSDNNSAKLNANYFNPFMELYSFNNTMQTNLHLQRDNEKPFIKIISDGVEIKDSAYVSMSPHFEIELYDYSFEPVLAIPEPIRVRINSVRQTESNTEDYKLELINKDEFKAVLGFTSDTLYDWDNRIEVIFQDAAGNTDTVEYHIFTSLNALLSKPQCEPNPVNENAKFTFNYRASDNDGTATIKIFDITGREIKKLRSNLLIGKNELVWDGYDNYGNSISQGIYLFVIESQSLYFTEPITGKFVKLR